MTIGLYFPSPGVQALICFVYLAGITMITYCLAHRIPTSNFRRVSWVRWLNVGVFVDSWMFTFTSGMLIFGIGLETSLSVCTTGVFLCIVFYASTKALLYVFLIEKVHVVWATHNQQRLKSPVYLLGLLTIVLYAIVGIVLIIGRVNSLQKDTGFCFIGVKFYASITLVTYDLYITLFLTSLFLWPLMKSKITNPRLRKVASRNLVSSTVALTMSTVNIAVLTAYHGHQRGYMCLSCCTTDIIFNSLALFWVTNDVHSTANSSHNQYDPENTGPNPKNSLVVKRRKISGTGRNTHDRKNVSIESVNPHDLMLNDMARVKFREDDKTAEMLRAAEEENGQGQSDSVTSITGQPLQIMVTTVQCQG
ncbi:hypothetical protein D9758_012699 [Tetrapyrgos nigripes]|uniref:Transmembrane protein n=1 Tax=Tetrapyrgos nigripes TaxID=182062 RepID=A0A8H5CXP2_9AGAR|nr:hypothetical protein D9758_012699 [Tetrapyrgos nigripes]